MAAALWPLGPPTGQNGACQPIPTHQLRRAGLCGHRTRPGSVHRRRPGGQPAHRRARPLADGNGGRPGRPHRRRERPDLDPALQLATWLFQVMPLFFIAGGFSNITVWRSLRRRGAGCSVPPGPARPPAAADSGLRPLLAPRTARRSRAGHEPGPRRRHRTAARATPVVPRCLRRHDRTGSGHGLLARSPVHESR